MSKVHSPENLKMLMNALYIADDADTMKKFITDTYGPLPIQFSAATAVTPGQADVTITDILPAFKDEELLGRPFPGCQARGYANVVTANAHVRRGSADEPCMLFLLRSHHWTSWSKPTADRDAGLVADAAHPGVPS